MADFTKSKPRFLRNDLFFVSIDLYNSKGCCFVLNICRHALETGRLSLASRLSASFQTNQNTRRQALTVPMTVPLAAGFICSAEIVSLDMLSCGKCAEFLWILCILYAQYTRTAVLSWLSSVFHFVSLDKNIKICKWHICTFSTSVQSTLLI